ncbi:MAG: Crp/Fnr family transcriptional regulator [Bacteroidota bacterium]
MPDLLTTFQQLKKLYQLSVDLTFKDMQVLIGAAGMRAFAPQEYLMEEGSQSRMVYLIREGLIRTFFVNDKGDEITNSLRWQNQVYTNTDLVLFDRPSRFYVQALEPTKTFTMDYDKLQLIIDRNPKFEKNRKHILLDILKQSLEQSESFILLTPEERYQRFVRNRPDIINRVPGKYIANILGITPVSLSRIRKRIAEKEMGKS